MDEDKVIKDAQYRKGLSIAFFNATNVAIEMLKLLPATAFKKVVEKGKGKKKTKTTIAITREEKLVEIRNWLLDEHKKYYAEVIAKVGTNYSVEKSLARLAKVKNQAELNSVWLSFSEDERHDGDIRKLAQSLQEKFKNVKA